MFLHPLRKEKRFQDGPEQCSRLVARWLGAHRAPAARDMPALRGPGNLTWRDFARKAGLLGWEEPGPAIG
jgi:hypothetical protein